MDNFVDNPFPHRMPDAPLMHKPKRIVDSGSRRVNPALTIMAKLSQLVGPKVVSASLTIEPATACGDVSDCGDC